MRKSESPNSDLYQDVARAVDVVLFDRDPLQRVRAKAFLREWDLETVLVAARGSAVPGSR